METRGLALMDPEQQPHQRIPSGWQCCCDHRWRQRNRPSDRALRFTSLGINSDAETVPQEIASAAGRHRCTPGREPPGPSRIHIRIRRLELSRTTTQMTAPGSSSCQTGNLFSLGKRRVPFSSGFEPGDEITVARWAKSGRMGADHRDKSRSLPARNCERTPHLRRSSDFYRTAENYCC